MKNMRFNVYESLKRLTPAEKQEHSAHFERFYRDVQAKYQHSSWCELETGLWHSCDCGASEEREKAFDKISYVWLKRRGKYVEVIK